MIRTSTTYEAVYRLPKRNGEGYLHRTSKVEAWSAEGAALVADEQAGRLVEAAVQSGFQELQLAGGRYIAALPAEGWVATFATRSDPAQRFTEPVLCWLVEEDGTVAAVSLDADGLSEVLTSDVRESNGVTFSRPERP
jgi:hypothetical protein